MNESGKSEASPKITLQPNAPSLYKCTYCATSARHAEIKGRYNTAEHLQIGNNRKEQRRGL
jgi:hypothetical protein